MQVQAAAYARQALETAADLLRVAKPASRVALVQVRAQLDSSRSYLDTVSAWSDDRSGERSETVEDLRAKLEKIAQSESMANVAPQVVQAIADVNRLLQMPGSPVIEVFLRTAAEPAPRPLALAFATQLERIAFGPADPRRERIRAIELAFQTALRLAPLAIGANGGEFVVVADALSGLGGCSGDSIAALLREEYCPLLSGHALDAARAAADALSAAAPLDRLYDEAVAAEVAAHAGVAVQVAIRAGAGDTFDVARQIVDELLDLAGTSRAIVERPATVRIRRLAN
jgi:hypothetical protein